MSGANTGTVSDPLTITGSSIRAGSSVLLSGLNNGSTTITIQGRRITSGSSVTIYAAVAAKNY